LKNDNPYRLDPPFYVSFSGGRTSGYLLRHVLDAFDGTLPNGCHVLFANTGKEHESTLEFVHEIEKRWCPVTWLEFRNADPIPVFQIVNFETASRDGRPFMELNERFDYLPNAVSRSCTGQLKVSTMQRYLRSTGVKIADITAILGLRADEPRRVSRVKNDQTRNLAVPLADAGVTRDHVNSWWSMQEFDLRLPNNDDAYGNCDLCFLKSRAKIERIMEREPERAEWWINQETLKGKPFRSDRGTYKQILHQVTIQGKLFGGEDDSIPCDCTE
jgi:3'-phosphoadenosine 5'-phosphosulfate sulfotransferase (PAPS reductase)/FAD synthetase